MYIFLQRDINVLDELDSEALREMNIQFFRKFYWPDQESTIADAKLYCLWLTKDL